MLLFHTIFNLFNVHINIRSQLCAFCSLYPISRLRETPHNRVGGKNNKFSRPLTPPCIRFRTRRFLSFHKLPDNSQAWMCILAWLLFSLKRFGLALSPFSNNLFCYRRVLLLSNAQALMLSTFDTLS